jgi:hypothetical protein
MSTVPQRNVVLNQADKYLVIARSDKIAAITALVGSVRPLRLISMTAFERRVCRLRVQELTFAATTSQTDGRGLAAIPLPPRLVPMRVTRPD